MRSFRGTVNRVELIGRLGADPEVRQVGNGVTVCRFNLATNRPAGIDEQGKRLSETEWTTVEAWERLAEVCGNYLQKGRRVMVMGSLRTDNWQDKESGQPRSRTYVRAEEVIFLDGGNGRQDNEQEEE
ncbi:MAG: single-stranded DNA-binding protein [Chloroflexus sp.]|nr:single-stranded DNA-binding protein [Chloroflexus sp.]MBO9315944.1 single-stranded DNA-binding protein [Chloroflexus sp.]MBO9317599.1 single-stranded DNA-binding protein [Chloroflexus sp.]MBO9337303.1 single-stranded DNA-binding protein [Chloroflexus sp.]MBO9371792.1 single-stranded DNA-binding protein [Chloroflexus sp.]